MRPPDRLTRANYACIPGLALIVGLLSTSCSSSEPVPTNQQGVPLVAPVTRNVYRIIDDEADVACYVYEGFAISCLPLAQTKLQPEQP